MTENIESKKVLEPLVERINERNFHVPTLRKALADYIDMRQLRTDTADQYKKKTESCLSDWLELPLSSIDDRMVIERHKQMKHCPSQADYVFRILRAIYRFSAVYYRQPTLVNPVLILSACRQWQKSKTRRDDYIDKQDLRTWYDAVQTIRPHMRDLVLLLVLTGLRLNEAAKLQWSDVDLEKGRITIGWDPKRPTKNGFIHRLPLSDFLVSMLERRKKMSNSQWVFTSRHYNAPIQNPYKSFKYVSGLSGVRCRPHTLRRTFINLATIEEVMAGPDIRKALLNHVEGVHDGHYETIDEDRLRRVMQAITDQFFKHAGVRRRLYGKNIDSYRARPISPVTEMRKVN